MGYIYGYHRVSDAMQHLDRGINEIESYCQINNLQLHKIYTDKISGTTFIRPRYTVLKEDVLKPGDTLIITELDRLGRNKKETMEQIKYFSDNNIRLMVLELPTTLMDLSDLNNDISKIMLETINNMMLELYASMAQAELEKKQKRQAEGTQAMKARGEWEKYGRPRIMSLSEFEEHYKRVDTGEISGYRLMRELNMPSGTFYRYKKELLEKRGNT